MYLFKRIPSSKTVRAGYRFEDVPNKIHVLWVGGNISEVDFYALHKLSAKCRTAKLELNLWLESTEHFYKTSDACELRIPHIRLRDIKEINDPFKALCNTKEYKLLMLFIALEMIGSSNFATLSDFYRLMILLLEGGCWLDMDIEMLGEFEKYRIDSINSSTFFANTAVDQKNEKWFGIKMPTHHYAYQASRFNTFIIFTPPHYYGLYQALECMLENYDKWRGKKYGENNRTLLDTKKRLSPIMIKAIEERTVLDAKRLRPTSIKAFENDSSRRRLTIRLGPGIMWQILRFIEEKIAEVDFIEASTLPNYLIEPGNGYFPTDLFMIPKLGIACNHGRVTWDVRPPSSFEEPRNLRF